MMAPTGEGPSTSKVCLNSLHPWPENHHFCVCSSLLSLCVYIQAGCSDSTKVTKTTAPTGDGPSTSKVCLNSPHPWPENHTILHSSLLSLPVYFQAGGSDGEVTDGNTECKLPTKKLENKRCSSTLTSSPQVILFMTYRNKFLIGRWAQNFLLIPAAPHLMQRKATKPPLVTKSSMMLTAKPWCSTKN